MIPQLSKHVALTREDPHCFCCQEHVPRHWGLGGRRWSCHTCCKSQLRLALPGFGSPVSRMGALFLTVRMRLRALVGPSADISRLLTVQGQAL